MLTHSEFLATDHVSMSLTKRPDVRIGGEGLRGALVRTVGARGLVVLVRGNAGHCQDLVDHRMADIVQGYRLDTLLLDLRADADADAPRRYFHIDRQVRRLGVALQWVRAEGVAGQACAGLLASNSDVAVALAAAARYPGWVTSVVSCGGRIDLAPALLAQVQAPTLLVVGGQDAQVLKRNRHALRAMRCETRLEVVPAATHWFRETGAIETVAHLAGSWFAGHLPARLN